MSDLERIVVLAGGLSPEREVSLRSGDRVCDALVEAGIHAIVADADSALLSSKLVKNATLKIYKGAPHGMCTTHKHQVNEEIAGIYQRLTTTNL